MPSARVIRSLERIIEWRGKPSAIGGVPPTTILQAAQLS